VEPGTDAAPVSETDAPRRPDPADVRADPPAAPWRLLGWWVATLAVALVHNGLWATPNLAFMSLVADRPGVNPFRGAINADYLLTNLSLPTLARLLGQTDPHAYARLHLVLLVVGWALVTVLAARRFGYRAARNLTVLMALSPAVTVSLQWLGQPDPLTFTLGLLLVVVRPRRAVLAVAVVAGLTHPEQAVFMALVAAAVRAVLADPPGTTEPPDPGRPATGPRRARPARVHRPAPWGDLARATATDALFAVAGVVIGRAVTEVYFRINDIVLLRPRSDYLGFGVDRFVEHHTQQPAGLLYTLWGPLWLVIAAVVGLRVVRRGRDPRSARAWAVLAALAVAGLVPVLVTLDETRVYAMVTAPLLVGAAVLLTRERPPLPARLAPAAAAVLLVVAAVVPGGFATGVTSWRGQLPQAEMREFLRTGDHPGDLTTWLLGPFDFVIPQL